MIFAIVALASEFNTGHKWNEMGKKSLHKHKRKENE